MTFEPVVSRLSESRLHEGIVNLAGIGLALYRSSRIDNPVVVCEGEMDAPCFPLTRIQCIDRSDISLRDRLLDLRPPNLRQRPMELEPFLRNAEEAAQL